jgi:hypothetical protein
MQCGDAQAFLLHVTLHGSDEVVNSRERRRCSHEGTHYRIKQGS